MNKNARLEAKVNNELEGLFRVEVFNSKRRNSIGAASDVAMSCKAWSRPVTSHLTKQNLVQAGSRQTAGKNGATHAGKTRGVAVE